MHIENCKAMDSIIINQYITITILSIKKSRVKMGIQTPCHIQTHRTEIHKKIREDAL